MAFGSVIGSGAEVTDDVSLILPLWCLYDDIAKLCLCISLWLGAFTALLSY